VFEEGHGEAPCKGSLHAQELSAILQVMMNMFRNKAAKAVFLSGYIYLPTIDIGVYHAATVKEWRIYTTTGGRFFLEGPWDGTCASTCYKQTGRYSIT
jgi:hypothetical protein